jgi:hypothetical protein
LNAGSVRPSRTRDWPGATRRRGREGTRDSTLHSRRRDHTARVAITSAHTQSRATQTLTRTYTLQLYAWWSGRAESSTAATLGHGSGSVRTAVGRIRGMWHAGFCLRHPHSRPLPALISMESNTMFIQSREKTRDVHVSRDTSRARSCQGS